MSFADLDLRRYAAVAAAAACLAGFVGCTDRDEIARYTVPKPELVDPTLHQTSITPTAGDPQQTLGAVFLVDDTGWFFKLIGDPNLVQPQRGQFEEFVKSVRFSEEPNPTPSWTLPAGWTEQPGTGMRHATIGVAAEGRSLELTVIPLPKRPGTSDSEYLLSNVNRWRSEVGLPPIDDAELSSETERLEASGREATLVDVTGKSKGGGMGGMMAGPFAGSALAEERPAPSGSPIDYQAPPQWNKVSPKAFSILTFQAGEGNEAVEITVSSVGGDKVGNVNRWRTQVGLSPLPHDELESSLAQIETLGTHGDYAQIVGEEQTILGVVAQAGGQQWFIKLMGGSELAAREKPRFEAFVKSLKLRK